MKFRSFDSFARRECTSEIRPADYASIRSFVDTWVSDAVFRILTDPDFSYQPFPWEKIIGYSLIPSSIYRCFAAYTNTRLDGLICLSRAELLKIDFIQTAPWNYSPMGKMRRIGSGLMFFAMKQSTYFGDKGEVILNALPDAENFYEQIIGMKATGIKNKEGLKEYKLSSVAANVFMKHFEEYVII